MSFQSGFCTLVGRPNVGKSTLLNSILGTKVTIVSDKPQTTRTEVRGVLHRPESQIVFVDTPGIHKPRTLLGERLNDTATGAIGDVDAVCLVIDATAPLGRGDRFVAARVPRDAIVVVTKVDIASPDEVLTQLAAAGDLDLSEYFPVSGITGAGVPALLDAIISRLPEGPPYYPTDMVADVPEAAWVAELVREQLLAVARDELPHSIATRVTEWEPAPHPLRDPRRARFAEGHRDRQGRRGAEAGGHRRARAAAPGARTSSCSSRSTRTGSAAPKALERLGY